MRLHIKILGGTGRKLFFLLQLFKKRLQHAIRGEKFRTTRQYSQILNTLLFHAVTRCYRLLHVVSSGCTVLPRVTRCFMVLHVVTGYTV